MVAAAAVTGVIADAREVFAESGGGIGRGASGAAPAAGRAVV